MAVSDVLALTVPALLAGVGLYGALTGTDVFSALTAGALDGLRTVVRIFPALVALLAAVAWLSRWFVRRERYDTDREEIAARLDVLAAEQARQAEEIRKKPGACEFAALAEDMRGIRDMVASQSNKLAVLDERTSAMQDNMARMDKQIHRITDKLMAGRA